MLSGSRLASRGRGGGKMPSFAAAPLRRPAAVGKAAMRGAALRNNVAKEAKAPPSIEERFELRPPPSETPNPCTMAIKLTPEVRAALVEGQKAGKQIMVKFSANQNGVIKIGDEEYRFKSAKEDPNLCKSYREEKAGDTGAGVLVESGSVSRKLSVQKELTETEKNRVKGRFEVAELKNKARKSIMIDPSHPLPSEPTGRRPPVKRKRPEITEVTAPVAKVTAPVAKALAKTAAPRPDILSVAMGVSAASGGLSTRATEKIADVSQKATLSKVNVSVAIDKSPSPPQQAAISPAAAGSAKEATPAVSASAPPPRSGSVTLDELRACLIQALTGTPRTIKAVQKIVSDSFPTKVANLGAIKRVLDQIADFKSPGRYFLKEGQSLQQPSPGSASSPEFGDSPALGSSLDPAGSPALPLESPQGTGGDGRPSSAMMVHAVGPSGEERAGPGRQGSNLRPLPGTQAASVPNGHVETQEGRSVAAAANREERAQGPAPPAGPSRFKTVATRDSGREMGTAIPREPHGAVPSEKRSEGRTNELGSGSDVHMERVDMNGEQSDKKVVAGTQASLALVASTEKGSKLQNGMQLKDRGPVKEKDKGMDSRHGHVTAGGLHGLISGSHHKADKQEKELKLNHIERKDGPAEGSDVSSGTESSSDSDSSGSGSDSGTDSGSDSGSDSDSDSDSGSGSDSETDSSDSDKDEGAAPKAKPEVSEKAVTLKLANVDVERIDSDEEGAQAGAHAGREEGPAEPAREGIESVRVPENKEADEAKKIVAHETQEKENGSLPVLVTRTEKGLLPTPDGRKRVGKDGERHRFARVEEPLDQCVHGNERRVAEDEGEAHDKLLDTSCDVVASDEGGGSSLLSREVGVGGKTEGPLGHARDGSERGMELSEAQKGDKSLLQGKLSSGVCELSPKEDVHSSLTERRTSQEKVADMESTEVHGRKGEIRVEPADKSLPAARSFGTGREREESRGSLVEKQSLSTVASKKVNQKVRSLEKLGADKEEGELGDGLEEGEFGAGPSGVLDGQGHLSSSPQPCVQEPAVVKNVAMEACSKVEKKLQAKGRVCSKTSEVERHTGPAVERATDDHLKDGLRESDVVRLNLDSSKQDASARERDGQEAGRMKDGQRQREKTGLRGDHGEGLRPREDKQGRRLSIASGASLEEGEIGGAVESLSRLGPDGGEGDLGPLNMVPSSHPEENLGISLPLEAPSANRALSKERASPMSLGERPAVGNADAGRGKVTDVPGVESLPPPPPTLPPSSSILGVPFLGRGERGSRPSHQRETSSEEGERRLQVGSRVRLANAGALQGTEHRGREGYQRDLSMSRKRTPSPPEGNRRVGYTGEQPRGKDGRSGGEREWELDRRVSIDKHWERGRGSGERSVEKDRDSRRERDVRDGGRGYSERSANGGRSSDWPEDNISPKCSEGKTRPGKETRMELPMQDRRERLDGVDKRRDRADGETYRPGSSSGIRKSNVDVRKEDRGNRWSTSPPGEKSARWKDDRHGSRRGEGEELDSRSSLGKKKALVDVGREERPSSARESDSHPGLKVQERSSGRDERRAGTEEVDRRGSSHLRKTVSLNAPAEGKLNSLGVSPRVNRSQERSGKGEAEMPWSGDEEGVDVHKSGGSVMRKTSGYPAKRKRSSSWSVSPPPSKVQRHAVVGNELKSPSPQDREGMRKSVPEESSRMHQVNGKRLNENQVDARERKRAKGQSVWEQNESSRDKEMRWVEQRRDGMEMESEVVAKDSMEVGRKDTDMKLGKGSEAIELDKEKIEQLRKKWKEKKQREDAMRQKEQEEQERERERQRAEQEKEREEEQRAEQEKERERQSLEWEREREKQRVEQEREREKQAKELDRERQKKRAGTLMVEMDRDSAAERLKGSDRGGGTAVIPPSRNFQEDGADGRDGRRRDGQSNKMFSRESRKGLLEMGDEGVASGEREKEFLRSEGIVQPKGVEMQMEDSMPARKSNGEILEKAAAKETKGGVVGEKKNVKNGKVHRRREVPLEEFFSSYEKPKPELKGPIRTEQQYLDYCGEYNEKFAVYEKILNELRGTKEDFEEFDRQLKETKAVEEVDIIKKKISKLYKAIMERHHRMAKTVKILQRELLVLRQRIDDYNEEQEE